MTEAFQIHPIGHLRSCFPDKFGVPRQAGVVEEIPGTIELLAPYSDPAAVDGLSEFSHLWLLWQFHQVVATGWRPRVRPPRLGGNSSLGVFATRSPFRPNRLGLSLVTLETVVIEQGRARLNIRGADLVDGTPIFDIKPFIAYADTPAGARCGFAETAPQPRLHVKFQDEARETIVALSGARGAANLCLIEHVLSLDPRPAYRAATDNRRYANRFFDFEVFWGITDGILIVETARPYPGAVTDEDPNNR